MKYEHKWRGSIAKKVLAAVASTPHHHHPNLPPSPPPFQKAARAAHRRPPIPSSRRKQTHGLLLLVVLARGVGGGGAGGAVAPALRAACGRARHVRHARRRGRLDGPRQPRRRRRQAPPWVRLPLGAHGRAARRRGARARARGVPHGARADPHVQREGGEVTPPRPFLHSARLVLSPPVDSSHLILELLVGFFFFFFVQVYKLSIGAACALTWPPDRIIIQVLDDSTDPFVKVSLGFSDKSLSWLSKKRGQNLVAVMLMGNVNCYVHSNVGQISINQSYGT